MTRNRAQHASLVEEPVPCHCVPCHCYFLGSVKSAKRFARLVSLTQSAKNCKRNVQKYFHDILNRVVVTVKDELINILPHKWVEPVTIPLVY